MKSLKNIAVAGLMTGLAATGAQAVKVDVTQNISVSQTWTANNTYNLTKQIYVLPGATLTIEAGTLVQSDAQANGGGSLAVTRGAKIFVNGTADKPVIMTSSLDDLHNWHEGVSEWGNLTIMGNALISASHTGKSPNHVPVVIHGVQNTATPTGLNQQFMEGLTPDDANDTKTQYGGNNDNDDSGGLHYLSLRYGGKVIGLANELNGLSMGGIGRETDVDHIDIMNNVDDGIETWGGTVCYKYINIWNIGDDCFDIDQGWRGKAQFLLLVQGYGADAAQGSGVGDNMFETDGAEDAFAQPVTTAVIYNATAIGQPIAGDQGTAWRDGARIQYRNCIFMDLGEQLIANDDNDGDGAIGYAASAAQFGTLTFAQIWTTPFTAHSTVNAGTFTPGAFNDPAVLYQSQTSGMLAEMNDSVFFRNLGGGNGGNNYTTATAVGVVPGNSTNHNVVLDQNGAQPIKDIQRHAPETKGGLTELRVIGLDPRAANDAVTSFASAPADGFFTPAPFRGACSKDVNWARGWTAADAYGFFTGSANATDPATAEIKLTASTSFATVAGVVYSVESSSDMKNWSPVGTIIGDGTTKSITDIKDFDNAKFYRAIAQ
ncbi:MAG: hypothetical protein GC162_07030 [Planctomycetes bacterium]|nr:hypothetical protein [Planctomycetota bacterium]